MYRKVSTDMNFVEREKEVLDFWKREGIMEKSFHHRDGAERFTFFDGPPTANGRPHIGHIETRAIKDLIPRFQKMCIRDRHYTWAQWKSPAISPAPPRRDTGR